MLSQALAPPIVARPGFQLKFRSLAEAEKEGEPVQCSYINHISGLGSVSSGSGTAHLVRETARNAVLTVKDA